MIMFEKLKKYSNKKNITFLALLGVILIGGGLFGYQMYQKWDTERETVADYINTNIKVYNDIANPSRQIIDDLNSLVEFQSANRDDTLSRLEQIEQKLQEIDSVNQKIDEDVEKIETGEIKETKELSRKIKNTMQVKKFTLQNVNEFLQYQSCLIENAVEQSKNLELFTANIENFSNNQEAGFEEKRGYIETANNGVKANIDLIDTLPSCFQDKYSMYSSLELQGIISQDRSLYVNYNGSLNQLQTGLADNDSPQVQNATEVLIELSKKNFELFQSEELKQAVKAPTSIIRDQAEVLDKQEGELDELLNSLKGTYFLQS